jgi:hypothetical protein
VGIGSGDAPNEVRLVVVQADYLAESAGTLSPTSKF